MYVKIVLWALDYWPTHDFLIGIITGAVTVAAIALPVIIMLLDGIRQGLFGLAREISNGKIRL